VPRSWPDPTSRDLRSRGFSGPNSHETADLVADRRRTIWLLLAATVACYGTGYPLALWGHSDAGWVLVFLGGPLLLTLGVLTVRQLHRSTARPPQTEAADSRFG
jgi:hypothetical protein